jgi:2'-5' RNA ligase
MKLFLGIDLPYDIKLHISHFLQPLQLSPKGWELPHDYHQTLLFIGESSEEELREIKERLSTVSFHSFDLSLGRFEFLNRRIMFLNFLPSDDLLNLKGYVDFLFPEWVDRSVKSFLPHITVKRWQRYEFKQLKEGLESKEITSRTFKVIKLSLFKSEKDSRNRKYHVIDEKLFSV